MRKEQKEIDRLGPLGIFREAFKLSSTYSKFFTMIQVTFLAPLALLVTLAPKFVLRLNLTLQNGGPAARARAPNLSSNFGASVPAGTLGLQLGLVFVASVLVWAVAAIFVSALVSLASAAIIYAVGLHYTGQIVSFEDVVRAVVPRLWMRLTITKIYKILLFCGIVTGLTLAIFLFIELSATLPMTHLGLAVRTVVVLSVVVLGVLSISGLIYVEIVFQLTSGVAVLEKDYGWAALRRAPKLLKGRMVVALLFELLFLVPSVLLYFLGRTFQSQTKSGAPSSSTSSVILAVLSISGSCFLWHMTAVCEGVQYASFKAYHNEDLQAETIFEKQVMKGGYEHMESGTEDLAETIFEEQVMKVRYEHFGSGTVDAKLGEHDAAPLV